MPVKFHADGDFLFINQPVWAADKRVVTFTLEKLDEINVLEEIERGESEIIQKRNITKMIENSLYK